MTTDENAIDNLLLWELCKQEGIQEMITEGFAEEELKEIIEKVRQEYLEEDYSLDEKKERLQELDSNPEYRIQVFENCSWRKETLKVEELGTTLPRAGDLPSEVITGTLSEVVEFVKHADPDKYQSVKYIRGLAELPDVLNRFYPWITTPGNRQSKVDRINKVHGERSWNITDTWGMINDGNHRTVAKILANDSDEIECFVGHRQY